MNDDDLMTAVRDRFGGVRMEIPAQQIMARGTSLRRRRSGGRLAAGALAISLGAGLSVPALTAGPSTAAQRATLAAWTVDKHPDGSIAVTIRRPQNLAALQNRLAQLGAPVTFAPFPGKRFARDCVQAAVLPARAFTELRPSQHAVAFKIEPAEIPAHALLRLDFTIRMLQARLKHGTVPIAAPRMLICTLPTKALKPAETPAGSAG